MDFFETLRQRHSYRKALEQAEIPLEDLKTIVRAGLDAPSGVNAQTTGFIIIRDPEVVETIRRMPGANGSMSTAPAYIACHIAREPAASYQDMSFDVEDCAAAVENILLAATALGYATVWIDGWLRRDNRAAEIGRMTGLGNDRIIRILIPVGRPVETQKRPEKKPFEERVTII